MKTRGFLPAVPAMAAALVALAAAAAAPRASAGDFPTIDRVEYVMECMRRNGSNETMLYKCSCVVDALAREYSYDDYVEGLTIVRGQGTVGEISGVFREGDRNREIGQRFRKVQSEANRQCGVPK